MEQVAIDRLSDIAQGREPFPFCQCYKAKEMPFPVFGGMDGPENNLMGLYRFVGETGGLRRYVCGVCGNTVKIMENDDGWTKFGEDDFLRQEIDKWRLEL